jgi:hypothetical protein
VFDDADVFGLACVGSREPQFGEIAGKSGSSCSIAKKTSQRIAESKEPDRSHERTGAPPKLITLSKLLDGASDAAKLEFLNSLRFVDGRVASVSTDLSEQDLGKARVRKIMRALNPHPQKVYMLGPFHTMNLCNENQCDGAICHSDDNGTGCVSRNNSICMGPCTGLR